MSQSNDLRIILIGNSKTGKTSFVQKFIKNTFSNIYCPTVAYGNGYKEIEKNGKSYKINLWAFTGNEKIVKISTLLIKGADGCIFFSDSTNIQTRKDSIKQKQFIDGETTFLDGGKIPCILFESKCDLLEDQDIYEEEIKKFAKENGFDNGFLGSSKTGKNINESFEYLLNEIIERMKFMKNKEDDNSEKSNSKENKILHIDEFEEIEDSDEKEEKEEREIIFGESKLIDLQDIKFYDSLNGEIEIYININEGTNKLKEYSYKQKFKEIKRKYKILNNIKNAKIFSDILYGLKERNKIKINLYLKKVVVQVGFIFTSILGEEEEITFELISEDFKKKI